MNRIVPSLFREARLLAFQEQQPVHEVQIAGETKEVRAVKQALQADARYRSCTQNYDDQLQRATEGARDGRYRSNLPEAIRIGVHMDERRTGVEQALAEHWKQPSQRTLDAYQRAFYRVADGATLAAEMVRRDEVFMQKVGKDMAPRLKLQQELLQKANDAVRSGAADASVMEEIGATAKFAQNEYAILRAVEDMDSAYGGINGYHQNRGPVERAQAAFSRAWVEWDEGYTRGWQVLTRHIEHKKEMQTQKEEEVRKRTETRESREKEAREKEQQETEAAGKFAEFIEGASNESGGVLESMPGVHVTIGNNAVTLTFDTQEERAPLHFPIQAGFKPDVQVNGGTLYIPLDDASSVAIEKNPDGKGYRVIKYAGGTPQILSTVTVKEKNEA